MKNREKPLPKKEVERSRHLLEVGDYPINGSSDPLARHEEECRRARIWLATVDAAKGDAAAFYRDAIAINWLIHENESLHSALCSVTKRESERMLKNEIRNFDEQIKDTVPGDRD